MHSFGELKRADLKITTSAFRKTHTLQMPFHLERISVQVTVFTFLSALAFPGNQTHDVGVASPMLHYLSYKKAIIDKY